MAKGWDLEHLRHSNARLLGKAGAPYRTKAKAPSIPYTAGPTPRAGETLFKINNRISVICKYEKTRNGFRHLATLYVNGQEKEHAKATYLNRTWESYDFQSVLQKVIRDSGVLSEAEKKVALDYAAKDHTDWSDFDRTVAVAQMGNILGKDQKEKNDWKARMLKAGLGNKGLDMPEDWDTLDEDTKQARLDAAIGFLKEHKEKRAKT